MPNVKINDMDFDLETLSDEAKAQIQNIRFVDQELGRLKAQIAVLQTARLTYASALQQALPAIRSAGEPTLN